MLRRVSPSLTPAHMMRLLAILLMSVLFSACGGDSAPQAQSNTNDTNTTNNTNTVAQAQNPTPDPANEGLVARVNGVGITEDAFQEALARRTANTTVTDNEALAQQVLAALIEQELINQSAAALGISLTDEEVQAEIDALKATVDGDEAWAEFLALNNFSEEEFFVAQRESLITQRLRDDLLGGLYGDVSQVRARHIVVRTESEANSVLSRLNNGDDFVAIASEVSIDATTSQNGGELGWFTAEELMDARLAEVAFALEPNQVAGPISTRIGYHIIQTLEKGERPIEPERMPMLMESVFVNWLGEQLSNAQIERYR
jgi:parvulin-like peptidyl-prolyl isomerase